MRVLGDVGWIGLHRQGYVCPALLGCPRKRPSMQWKESNQNIDLHLDPDMGMGAGTAEDMDGIKSQRIDRH